MLDSSFVDKKTKHKKKRYDRQRKLFSQDDVENCRILIINFDSYSSEIIKNLLLIGHKYIFIFDEKVVSEKDSQCSFLFNKEDIGGKRVCEKIRGKLRSMNPYSEITVVTEEEVQSEKYFKKSKIDVVICSNFCDIEKKRKLSEICDKIGITFFDTHIFGLVGRIYSSYNNPIRYGEYCESGVFSKKYLLKKSYCVEYSFCDSNKWLEQDLDNVCELSHAFFIMDHFYCKNKETLPCMSDFSIFCNLYEEIFNRKIKNKELMKRFIFSCKGYLPPIATIFSGILSNEVTKVCSKRKGCLSFFLLDFFSYVPLYVPKKISTTDGKLKRYDHQIVIFGEDFQRKILDTVCFVVGAGATGCETLKMLSLMGCKKIIVTDNDHVSESNLSRQFFYNDNDVKSSLKKSIAAGKKVKEINQSIVVQSEVSLFQNDKKFSNSFFKDVDVIFSCVDNNYARHFQMKKSILFEKTLLDVGIINFSGECRYYHPHFTGVRKFSEEELIQSEEKRKGIFPCAGSSIKGSKEDYKGIIRTSRYGIEMIFCKSVGVFNKYGAKSVFKYNLSCIKDCVIACEDIFSEMVAVVIQNTKYKIPKINVDDVSFVNLLVHIVCRLMDIFSLREEVEKEKIGSMIREYYKNAKKIHNLKELEERQKLKEFVFDKDDDNHINFITCFSIVLKDYVYYLKEKIKIEINDDLSKDYGSGVFGSVVSQAAVSSGFSLMNYYCYIFLKYFPERVNEEFGKIVYSSISKNYFSFLNSKILNDKSWISKIRYFKESDGIKSVLDLSKKMEGEVEEIHFFVSDPQLEYEGLSPVDIFSKKDGDDERRRIFELYRIKKKELLEKGSSICEEKSFLYLKVFFRKNNKKVVQMIGYEFKREDYHFRYLLIFFVAVIIMFFFFLVNFF